MCKYLTIFTLLLSLNVSGVTTVETDCLAMSVPNLGPFETNVISQHPELPAFCQVQGVLKKRIHFAARLPLKDWNGKFLMAGCGGFCGKLLPDKPGFSNSINEALKMGYATIAHDGGHSASSFEVSWAYNDSAALEIWAHEILPIVAESGKAITQSLYGKPPALSYFSGCSNGGRLGFMAAQRYPDLFDGILAGAPIFDLSGNAGIKGAWSIQQLLEQDGSLRIKQEKIPLIKAAILKQCDALDGLQDGIIADPRQCQADLSSLQCGADQDTAGCLRNSEISLLNKLYQGAVNSRGDSLYPGTPYGSEHYFSTWMIGKPGQAAWGPLASQGYLDLVNQIVPGQHYAAHQFDFDKDPELLRQKSIAQMMDAKSTDLSALRKSGTKLLIWHGWSDPLILPQRTVDYYAEVVDEMGGIESTTAFARLFMIPGHGHCWNRTAEAPDLFNPIQLLDDWVESAKTPEQFTVYQKDSSGHIIRSRSICAYPAVARYTGKGDVNDAKNYRCKMTD